LLTWGSFNISRIWDYLGYTSPVTDWLTWERSAILSFN